MSTCNFGGCKKPNSLLFSHIAGPDYHRYSFCSEEHQSLALRQPWARQKENCAEEGSCIARSKESEIH